MRKSLAILLLAIYIISSSGVAIRAHYSAGKLKSINLVLDSSSDKVCTNTPKVSKGCPKSNIAKDMPCEYKAVDNSSNRSLKAVLNCVGIVSQGFIQTYDDTDSTPVCNTCSAEPVKTKTPSHFVSID